MKLSLTVWQIINCQQIIGAQTGDFALIRIGEKCLDALELTEAQKKSVNLRLITGNNEAGSLVSLWAWDNQEKRIDVEIADRNAADYFRKVLTAHKWLQSDVKQVGDLPEQLEKE